MQWLKVQFVFWPTLLWNVVLGRWLKLRPWWSSIDEHIVLGALPFKSDVKKLYEMGVRGVVNTCLEYEGPLEEYKRLGIEQLHIPTVDFTHPKLNDVEKAIEFIDSQVENAHKTYIHCKAGRARSATVLLCWLCHHYRMSAEAAQQLMLEKRSHVNPLVKDRAVVKEYLANRHRDNS